MSAQMGTNSVASTMTRMIKPLEPNNAYLTPLADLNCCNPMGFPSALLPQRRPTPALIARHFGTPLPYRWTARGVAMSRERLITATSALSRMLIRICPVAHPPSKSLALKPSAGRRPSDRLRDGGCQNETMAILYQWQGDFENAEVGALHAEAFNIRPVAETEQNWRSRVARHSLGWVTARHNGAPVGFVNVVWDGLIHAWIQDTMVAADHRAVGIGKRVIEVAMQHAARSGCEWLHVDFDDHLRDFYLAACGFTPTSAGLIQL